MSFDWEHLGEKLHQFSPLLAALVIAGATAPSYIDFLRKRYLGQYIREDGPQHHQVKKGTPTAGGVLILAATVLALLLSYFPLGPLDALVKDRSLFTPELLIVAGVTLIFGALGFVDDYLKISKKKNKGVSGYTKLAVQCLCGLGVGWYMMTTTDVTSISIFNFGRVDLGIFYPLFAVLVITGASNAVNLTDGLDGLAGSTVCCTLLALAILFIGPSFDDVAEVYPDLALIAYCLFGGTAGFLVYNLHPARIFMGDTGSLALGGAIGTMAVLSQTDFWLLLLGGVFVLEALSVILQVASFKLTGKRIFKMAPLHHHFELMGWSETKVVLFFFSLQVTLCALAVFLYNK